MKLKLLFLGRAIETTISHISQTRAPEASAKIENSSNPFCSFASWGAKPRTNQGSVRWLRTLNRPRWTERLLRPEVKFASVEMIFFKTSRSLLENWNPKQHCQYFHSAKNLHYDFFGRSDVCRFPNCEGNVRQLARAMGSMGCDGLGWEKRNIQRMLQTFPAGHGMTCWPWDDLLKIWRKECLYVVLKKHIYTCLLIKTSSVYSLRLHILWEDLP